MSAFVSNYLSFHTVLFYFIAAPILESSFFKADRSYPCCPGFRCEAEIPPLTGRNVKEFPQALLD